MACYRCGRSSHYASECYARSAVTGEGLFSLKSPPRDTKSKSKSDGKSGTQSKKSSQNIATKADVCYRCGRDSHFASDCYAKSSVDGRDLTPVAVSRATRGDRDSPFSSSPLSRIDSIIPKPTLSGGKRKNHERDTTVHIPAARLFERRPPFNRGYSDSDDDDDDDNDDDNDDDVRDSEDDDFSSDGDSDYPLPPCFLITEDETTLHERPVNQRRDGGMRASSAKKDNPKPKGTVYVLELAGGKYYVGKTRNLCKREAQHASGAGSAWTRANTVLRSVPTSTPDNPDDLESWERAETLHLAYMHGIENVRGHKYTAVDLSADDRQRFFEDICERKDLCRKCGRDSHMVSECYATSKAEWARG